MVCYRFDLAYAVLDKSIMSNSKKQQWDAERWIPGYIRGTAKLQCHGDAEFGGDLVPRRSTTSNADYVFTLAECVNGWKMVLHEMLVSSTIEAEHMVVADASGKALRWQGLVRKFRRDSIRVLEDYMKRNPADMKTKAILVEKFRTLLSLLYVLQL